MRRCFESRLDSNSSWIFLSRVQRDSRIHFLVRPSIGRSIRPLVRHKSQTILMSHSYLISVVHSFIHSFIHSHIHSFIHSLIHLFIQNVHSSKTFVHSFLIGEAHILAIAWPCFLNSICYCIPTPSKSSSWNHFFFSNLSRLFPPHAQILLLGHE